MSRKTSEGASPRAIEAGEAQLHGAARSDLYAPTRDPDDISRAPDPRDEQSPPAWREDFPIDWPKDELVARRDFAKFMVLTSGAFTVGQGWIAAQQLLRHQRPAPPRLKICAEGELAPGEVRSFSYPGAQDRCLLVRLPEGGLVAFSQACTHLSCAVIPQVDEGVFLCPCHEGYFDLRTGRNLSGPPPRPLPRIVLAIEGGEVFATGVEERTVG
jgi:Rieske Fe-S protein